MFVYLQTRCATELVEAGLRSGFSLWKRLPPPQLPESLFSGRMKVFGLMAEWLGKGLQNLVQRFESASDLEERLLSKCISSLKAFLFCDKMGAEVCKDYEVKTCVNRYPFEFYLPMCIFVVSTPSGVCGKIMVVL